MTVGIHMLETVPHRSYFEGAKNLCPNFVVCHYHLPDTMAVDHGYIEHAWRIRLQNGCNAHKESGELSDCKWRWKGCATSN
jgi:hypothetical protein